MNRAQPRLPRILIWSAFALAALGPTLVLAQAPGGPAKDDRAAQDSKATALHVTCDAVNPGPAKVASDPEEGGQIARKASGKVKVSDMSVTKRADASSPTMSSTAPPGSAPQDSCAAPPR